jgi:hypothetical protein
MKKRWSLLVAFLLGLITPYLVEFGSGQIGRLYFADGEKEVFRSTSPDGRLDAVVIQNNPGAFSSFQYFLYFVPKGTRVRDVPDNPAIVSTSEGDELKVLWTSPHFIAVDPGNSHVKFFANYWYSARMPNYGVELDYAQSPSRHYLRPDGSFHSSSD